MSKECSYNADLSSSLVGYILMASLPPSLFAPTLNSPRCQQSRNL